jgi:hypothetical protein
MPTGDPLKHVRSGDKLRIPAAVYNAFIDTTRQSRARQQDQRQGATPRSKSSTLIRVKNASGTDQPRFAVMGISSPILASTGDNDHFKSEVTFSVTTPTTAHRGRFVVLQEPLASGAIGTACVAGVTLVKLSVPANADAFDRADVKDADAGVVESSLHGSATILWREGTSNGWAVIRLGAAVPEGVTFQVSLTQDGGNAGGASADCSWTYTVHPFGNPDFELVTEQSPKRYRLPLIEYENAGDGAGANIGLACYQAGEVVLLDVLTERPKLNPDCEETSP